MKVLHFYRTYFPDTQGGLEETIRQICACTQPHGIESRVLTLSPNPVPKIASRPEAEVYRAKLTVEIASCSMSFQAIGMFRELADWADVIHYHFPWPFADLAQLLVRPNKPGIVTYHSDIVRQKWLGRIYSPLMFRFLGNASRIVSTSPNYALSSPVLKKYSDQVTVIPIGLDEAMYPPATEEKLARVRSLYGANFFLFIGVLRHYKALHILLNAIKGAEYQLVIVGTGPMEQALRRQAADLNLTNVRFAGYVPDEEKVALLKSCLGVVLPSSLRSEAFGVSLLEGAMMANPLISAEIGTGTSYINIHEETGLVIPPADPVALRAAMDTLHSQPGYAKNLGQNARKRFEKLFSADLMGRRYAGTYHGVASCRYTDGARDLLTSSRQDYP